MISTDQAANALAYLEALAAEGLMSLLKKVDAETARYNIDMQKSAIYTLRAYLNNEDVKIVYEYKLQRTTDQKYMNTSIWDNKGKTYKSRGAMASAISYHIQAALDKIPYVTLADANGDYERYKAMYAEGMKARRNKTFRATFIPEEWTVISIPVNTRAAYIYTSAKDWYLNKKV